MADLTGKLKNWLGKDSKQKESPPPEKAAAEPALPQIPPPQEKILQPADMPAVLIAHRDEARKKLSELSQELDRTRKNLETDFRKKSEERIRLFAQLAHSDSEA